MTSEGTKKRLSDLQIGDEVVVVDTATGDLSFSPVITFLDRDPKEKRQFYVITTETGQKLTLTPTHLVYSTSGGSNMEDITSINEVNIDEESSDLTSFEAVYAKDIQEGDLLLVQNSRGQVRPARVSTVEMRVLTGVYAPLTSMGNLVVDNIVASCYAVVDSQWVAHTAFAPLRIFSSIWPQNNKVIEGVHWYANSLYSLAEYVMPRHLAAAP